MLTSIEDALTQYAENIDDFDNISKLKLLREAILYLFINKAKVMQHGNQKIDYDSLQPLLDYINDRIDKLEKVTRSSWTRGRIKQ